MTISIVYKSWNWYYGIPQEFLQTNKRYSRLPITRTLAYSNQFSFLFRSFSFTLDNSNLFQFPLKVRVIGSRLYFSYRNNKPGDYLTPALTTQFTFHFFYLLQFILRLSKLNLLKLYETFPHCTRFTSSCRSARKDD